MRVKGCDCSIVIKTTHRETSSPQSGAVRLTSSLARLNNGLNIPYSEETLREAVSLLQEEPAIEGDGISRAIRKRSGVTGCVITPLTIGTAPLLLYMAMGSVGNPVFIYETRNLYKYQLNLLPMEDTDSFDLVQDRGGERKLYEACRVQGFELRVNREETLKLKLDICGDRTPVVYPYTDTFSRESGELFNGYNVRYRINGKEYINIYGLTLSAKKEIGTRTELWIKRILDNGSDIPEIIDEITIIAQLLRDKYEYRRFGTFRITVKELVLASDETNIDTSDTVIGPLRYYVAGTVTTEVFTNDELGMRN